MFCFGLFCCPSRLAHPRLFRWAVQPILLIAFFAIAPLASAQVTASPSSISWWKVAVGNTGGAKSATLTNAGSSTLNISSIAFTGTNPGDFIISKKTCGSTLAASSSCTVTVQFRPTAAGTRTANLTFTDSDGSSPQQVALSGIGTGGTTSVTPTSLSFGTVTKGTTSASQNITVTNSSSSTVTLSTGTISGTNSGDFAVASTNCGASLAPSASCTAAINFTPSTTSSESAAWSMTAGSTSLSVALSGTGASGGSLSASPSALSFGSINEGSTSASQTITISNGTSSAVSLGAGAVSGTNAGDFPITSTTCTSSLAASSSCTAAIAFKPTTTSAESATWTITTGGSPSSLSVALSGTGASAGGNATVSPTSLSWYQVAVGNTGGGKIATLTNNGSTTINISSISFTGADPSDFVSWQNTCGSALAAAANCTVTVYFRPTTTGTRTATLSITDTAGNSPQQVSLSGTGTGGTTSVSPASLSFGTVTKGTTSATQTITVSNSTASSVTLSSGGFSGTNAADFGVASTTCGSSLAASASCVVQVTFTPSTTSSESATWSITAGSTSLSVALSGTGVAAGTLSASPSALSFGSVNDGSTSASQTITISNGTSSSVSLGTGAVSGTNAGDFPITSTTCGSSLAASASCTVSIAFKPMTTSAESATWTITTGGSPSSLSVALSGTGAAAGTLSATPSALSFGSVNDGSTSASQTITISNGTSSSVSLGTGTISGTNGGDFSVTSTTCTSSLAASSSCTAAIAFKPTTTAAESATWTITTGGSPSSLSVALSGTGAAAGGDATVSPTSLSWWEVQVGNTGGGKIATLTNNSSNTIDISSIAFTGADPSDFVSYQKTCGTTLAASASCTVTVYFRPTVPGTRTAMLTITDNAGNSPQQVSLTGQGTGIAASPSALSFGAVNVGTTSPSQVITISNTTANSLTLSAGTFSGTYAADFATASTTCGSSIAASSSCTVNVTFTPSTASKESATWTMTSSGSPTPLTVALSGTGGAVTVSPSSVSFGSVNEGSSSSAQTITVTNAEPNSVTLSAGAVSGTNAADFVVTSTTCGGSLAASTSCTANITFTPSTSNNESATWSMTTSGSPTPLSVALTGTGANSNSPISPSSATVQENGTQQFTAAAGDTWSASCGSVTSSGLYTAPLAPGTCTVTATPALGSPASATVTVTSPITLTPASANLHALDTQQFTASAPVAWTDSCNAISSTGLFTAPASAGSCTITATASSGTAFTAVATVSVDVVNYTTWRGGPTGAGSDELALTPANVNSTSFGLLWQTNVDGWVNAQPLYMNGLTINGSPHNVLFVATENDSVYALDADTGAVLWQVSLIPPGATSVSATSVGYSSVQPQFGILSTPVIDPSTNTMYVVAETSEQNATYFPHRLHALDLTTGEEKFGGPVLISNPQMVSVKKLQRPALLLANGNVYVGIGSMQDTTPYNGMLFAFNATTLAQEAVWVAAPSGSEAGIWLGGASPAADESASIYIATGNGTFDGLSNFGQSDVRLSSNLQLLDYFTPYDYNIDNTNDRDLGSSGILVIPDQTGPYPHEMISCGKTPSVYLLNRDNLGHVGTTSDNVIQRIDGQVGNPAPNATNTIACFDTPAIWGQNVYFAGTYDVLKMFTLSPTTGLLSSTPVVQGSMAFGSRGAGFTISANGSSNGIVWTLDTHSSTLTASDASSLQVLYSSGITGGVLAWTVPTVVNGHVYVGEKGAVFAFGLK